MLCLTGCHDDGLSREQRAVRQSAERCYSYLVKGKYDAFVDELSGSEHWPASYRRQMSDLLKEHMSALTSLHGSLLTVKAVGDSLSDERAQVFLQLTFADKTSEEIGISMRRVEGNWRME